MYEDSRVKPYLAGIIFSVFVGFSFVGIKIALENATVMEVLVYRYNFAMFAIILLLLFRAGKINIKEKPKKKILLVAFFYIFFMILQTLGLMFSSSVESAILFAIIPILVQILAQIFLKEKATLVQNIFVFICVTSLIYMIVVSSNDISFNLFGIILLLLASISMAVNNVMMRDIRNTYRPFEITAVTVIIGFFVFNLGYFLINGKEGIGNYLSPLGNFDFIIATLYLGVFCILFSSQLMAYMQAKLPSVEASIFGNISTGISIVAGVVILGETLKPYHIICSVIIIFAVIGISLCGRKKDYAK